MPKLMLETIPDALKELAQWVCWRYETREGKPTKVPYRPDGRKASTTDPKTWGSFADCVQTRAQFDGIGIVCANGLAGIDLDHCIDEAGHLSELAQHIVQTLNTYTEITPSEHGLHCLCFARLPDGKRRNDEKRIEMYDSARYLTVTGHHLPNTPLTIEKRENELARLHAEILGTREPIAQALPSLGERGEVKLDDQELLARAGQAKNGNEFRQLWQGDLSLHNNNHSDADLALIAHLAFWTGMDSARVDRLFRQSGLMRAKWDERHRADGATYGEMTIEKALSSGHDYFGSHHNNPGNGNGNGHGNLNPPAPAASPKSDHSKNAAEADALIAVLAQQPQASRDEEKLRQLFIALSKLNEFTLTRYQTSVTEKLNLTAREFRRLLNAVIREAHQVAAKAPPPEILSERYPLVMPALDFVDDLAVVTVPALMLVERKPVHHPCIVTSQHETLMLNEAGLVDLGGQRVLLGAAPQVISGEARWAWPDVQRFVKGDLPDPVETFLMVENIYAKYLDFCEPFTSEVLTLWNMGTYVHELFDTFAYLNVTGPSQSGKTKTIDVTRRIAFNMLSSSSISPAALYRVLQATRGALAIDEAERLANLKDPKGTDLRLLLDAGYKKGSPVIRYNAEANQVESFQVYGPKMIANIEGLGEVLESRCILIRMLRTMSDKGKLKVNDQCEPWSEIRHRLYCFALTHFATLRQIYWTDPEIQVLSNRTNELWQPLLAIAAFLSRYPGGPSDLLASIIEFATRKAEQSSGTGLEVWDEALIGALEKLTARDDQRTGEFSVKTIREAMTRFLSAEEVSEIKPQWIGYALRRFGLLANRQRKKHGPHGRHYVIVRDEVLDLMKRYGMSVTNEIRKSPEV